jgi:hypothetical protein
MFNLGRCSKKLGHNTMNAVDAALNHECSLCNFYLGKKGERHGAWRCPKKNVLWLEAKPQPTGREMNAVTPTIMFLRQGMAASSGSHTKRVQHAINSLKWYSSFHSYCEAVTLSLSPSLYTTQASTLQSRIWWDHSYLYSMQLLIL